MKREQLVPLVTAAKNGDSEAMNTLFNEYYNHVYYNVLKILGNDEAACEITQEVFIIIFKSIHKIKEPAAFVSWMVKIIINACKGYIKAEQDENASEFVPFEDENGHTVLDDVAEDKTEFIPDEAFDKEELKKTIMNIVDSLPDKQRTVVLLYYFDELSTKEIAEIQNIPLGTVKTQLNYARKKIKAAVEDYEKKNNVKLHAIPFFPLLRWVFEMASENSMPITSAEIVAEGVTAATGTTVTVATATATTATVATTATTAGAVGLGAKIAALPLATKIIAGVVAAAIAIGGGTTAVILSQRDNNDIPADNQSVVSSEDTDSNTSSETDTKNEELVLEGIIPEGCTYTLYDGTVLTAGQKFPEICTAGDKVTYGDFLYGYECVYAKNIEGTDTWHMWKDSFDSGDSGLIESDVFGSWSVMVADQTKTSYGVIASKINGKPIKTLYATFYECVNMTEAPKIPSTITAMTATYNRCIALEKAPVIPNNVERIMMSFMNCMALSGDVVINAKLDKSLEYFYEKVFSGTGRQINLIGETPEEDLILIAKGSNNKNITVNGKKIDYGNENVSSDSSVPSENDTTSSETSSTESTVSQTVIKITEDSYYYSHTSPHTDTMQYSPYYGMLCKFKVSVNFYPNGSTITDVNGSELTVSTPVAYLGHSTTIPMVPQDVSSSADYQSFKDEIMQQIADGYTNIPTTATWDELFTNVDYFSEMGGTTVSGVKYIEYSPAMGAPGDYYDCTMNDDGTITLTQNSNYMMDGCGYTLSNIKVSEDKTTVTATVTHSQGFTETVTLKIS